MKKLSLLMIAISTCALAQAPPPPAPPAKGAAPPAAAAPLPDGLYAIMTTGDGVIKVKLFEKETPVTVRNFVALAKGAKPWKDPKGVMVRKPLYNNITFHRVMMDGMIQAGDPTGTSSHDCGIKIKDEIVPTLKFDQPGRLAMANIGSPNTGGCQWFITVAPKIPQYDGGYTIFGQVVEGQDIVKQISRVPVRPDGSGLATKPVKLVSVVIQRVGPPPAPATPVKKAAPAKKSAAKP